MGYGLKEMICTVKPGCRPVEYFESCSFTRYQLGLSSGVFPRGELWFVFSCVGCSVNIARVVVLVGCTTCAFCRQTRRARQCRLVDELFADSGGVER